MKILHCAAEDLQVGDVILGPGDEVEVREIDRSGLPTIITNPGKSDEITGYAWQYVEIRRAEKT